LIAPVEKNGEDIAGKLPLLWLSMAHPGGRKAGSSTYSAGLIKAAASAGAAITLAAYGDGSALPCVRTETARQGIRGRWQSLASGLPASSWALASPEMKALVQRLLREQAWAAVVIDHAAMGWAAPLVRQAGIPLVYVSHNHEASTRREVARMARPFWKQPLLRWDAAKFGRLEQALVRDAALVSAITAEDAAAFRQQGGGAAVITLTPGYAGGLRQLPPLTPDTPRRVMLVGRYDWIAKQENLARWAAEGVPILAAAGVETAVIGHVPEALRRRLAAPGLRFLGEQADLAAGLADGRIGLVAEALGGGFKMKTLDYVFHGLTLAALPGGLTGLPDNVRANALTAATPGDLAGEILAAIDDLPRLSQMRAKAFQAAQQAFDWTGRGEMLVSAIKEHGLRQMGPTG
jgi:glycosyltransferase involved in cell wall biosynthesis